MSFNIAKLDFTIEASADLSAEQFRAVVIASGGAAVAGADVADIAGILQNNPDAAGQACVVQNKGVARAQVGEAVTRGAPLYTNGSGDLITSGTAGNEVATALEAGSGSGSVIAVLLI